MFAAPSGKMSLQELARPSYLYITCCPEEESDEKDAGGKRSCTERGLYIVVPFVSRVEVPRIDYLLTYLLHGAQSFLRS